MSYEAEFHRNLEIINEDVINDRIRTEGGALEKFSEYLNNIVRIGPFNSVHWMYIFRLLIYEFGKRIKSEFVSEFISIIDNKLEQSNKDEREILEFFKQEILFHHLPYAEMMIYLYKVVDEYPMNPEFRNDLGHCYLHKGDYKAAIIQY